ncbi:hypothetical protein ACFLUD_01845, partial [Chloroflexota bacterium]
MMHFSNIYQEMNTNRKRVGVVLFFLFAICILAVSLVFFILSIDTPYIGTVLSLDEKGWTVEDVDANGLASNAGIKRGDKPIEINGQPAQTFLEKYSKSGLVFSTSIKELSVVDDSGQLKSVALKYGSLSWQSLIEQISWLVICLIYWIVGSYVLFKRPRKVAAWLLFISGLALGLALSANMAAERSIPTAFELQVVASVIGPWLLLHFFLVLPDGRYWLSKNPLVYLIYLPATITLVLFPLVGWAEGQPVNWFRTVRLIEYGVGFLGATSVVIFNYCHSASSRTRQQMKIVLVSCLVALVPFLFLSVLPEGIWGRTIIAPGFSIIPIAFIPIGMGYAVVTQKLMDIDVIVRRSLIYGLITLVMAAILSAGIFPVLAFQRSIGVPEEILIALALGGIATILFGPTKKGIENLVDRFFYKDRYDYRQIIQSLGTSLKSVEDSISISRIIVGTSVHTLNLAGGGLFIKGQSSSYEVGAVQGTFARIGRQNQILGFISQRSYTIEFPNSASTVDSDVAFLIPLIAGGKEIG